MVKRFFHTLAAILENMAAMFKIHVASTFFLQSDPKGMFLQNVMLVSQFERFGQKWHLSAPLIEENWSANLSMKKPRLDADITVSERLFLFALGIQYITYIFE